jgi:hypothetical protein
VGPGGTGGRGEGTGPAHSTDNCAPQAAGGTLIWEDGLMVMVGTELMECNRTHSPVQPLL